MASETETSHDAPDAFCYRGGCSGCGCHLDAPVAIRYACAIDRRNAFAARVAYDGRRQQTPDPGRRGPIVDLSNGGEALREPRFACQARPARIPVCEIAQRKLLLGYQRGHLFHLNDHD